VPFLARLEEITSCHRMAAALLLLLFAFRLAIGLSKEFWFVDELQVYLIGLKFYSTGHWPFFGPPAHSQVLPRRVAGALRRHSES
jgi:hypothetical protein